MTVSTITLYHYWRSSASWRVRWALHHKGVPYTPIHVDIRGGVQRQNETFRALSPLGFVPVFVSGDHTLTESVAICEYLDDTIPADPLRPQDPWLCARMRQLVQIINANTQPFQNSIVLQRIAQTQGAQAEKGWAQFFIARGLQAFEDTLRTLRNQGVHGPYALGAHLTLADIFLVPQLYNARRMDVDPTPYRLCLAIEQEACASESCQAAMPESWRPSTETL